MAELIEFSCKGSIGVYYGMGIDELKIDFRKIKGLVALVGGNGMSKTTVLEMLSPFATFPSRKKKSPRNYNLKKQFRLRDSFEEVIYLHEGSEYVFRVEIPATTKTSSPENSANSKISAPAANAFSPDPVRIIPATRCSLQCSIPEWIS